MTTKIKIAVIGVGVMGSQHARDIHDMCKRLKQTESSFNTGIDILGPIEAPLSKIANRYRWQILLKAMHVGALHRFANRLIFENASLFNDSKVKTAVDVDPYFMM